MGLAPDADPIFVHFSTSTAEGPVLLGDSVAFLEALDFIGKVADGRQLVVNASLGRQCGQHDGQTLTERGMDAFLRAADGRAICFSAGNYYSRDMHTEGLLRPGERKAFRFSLDPSYGGTNEIDLWYPGLDRFGITVIAPDGSKVSAGPDGRAAVTIDGRAVGRLYHRIGDPNNGDNQVSLFLDPGAPRDVWQIELSGVDVADGRFHAWIERTAGGARRHARFLPDDIDRTCTTGTICNGHWTIATGAYDRHQASRPLARFSSSGPTRDGRPKPDLLAPGVRVLSARSRPRNATGDASLLTRMSGTSMAAPHVTGTVALMFAAAPRPLSVAETRRLKWRRRTSKWQTNTATRRRRTKPQRNPPKGSRSRTRRKSNRRTSWATKPQRSPMPRRPPSKRHRKKSTRLRRARTSRRRFSKPIGPPRRSRSMSRATGKAKNRTAKRLTFWRRAWLTSDPSSGAAGPAVQRCPSRSRCR